MRLFACAAGRPAAAVLMGAPPGHAVAYYSYCTVFNIPYKIKRRLSIRYQYCTVITVCSLVVWFVVRIATLLSRIDATRVCNPGAVMMRDGGIGYKYVLYL